MNDEAGFLNAIADQPAERATRLAYADWLEENDRAREAEFLKLQHQIAEANARLLEVQSELEIQAQIESALPNEWLIAVGGSPQKLILNSGRLIRLISLNQWHFTRAFWGIRTSQQNHEAIQRLVAEEQQRRNELPYLIQPTERPVEQPHLSGGPWGFLPSIACVGVFDSLTATEGKSAHGSQLTIIWFQDEFALPIDPGVREQIRAIDWDQRAHAWRL